MNKNPNLAIRLWRITGLLAYLVLPWYAIQDTAWYSVLPRILGGTETANGLWQALLYGRVWLALGLAGLGIAAMGLILLFGRAGVVNQFLAYAFGIPPTRWFYGLFGIWIAQLFAFTPIAFMIMRGVVQGVAPSMEEAAQTLRASRSKTFFTVTVLRMIARLQTPTSGQILMDGKDVTTLGPADRNVSMMFQSYALFPHMNVLESWARPCCSPVSLMPRVWCNWGRCRSARARRWQWGRSRWRCARRPGIFTAMAPAWRRACASWLTWATRWA